MHYTLSMIHSWERWRNALTKVFKWAHDIKVFSQILKGNSWTKLLDLLNNLQNTYSPQGGNSKSHPRACTLQMDYEYLEQKYFHMVSCQAIARRALVNHAVLAKWVTIYGAERTHGYHCIAYYLCMNVASLPYHGHLYKLCITQGQRSDSLYFCLKQRST